jgi:hypothetical protein
MQASALRHRRLSAVAVAIAVGAASCSASKGSTATTTSAVARDCPTPATTVSIGNPSRGTTPTELTTDGSPIYITTDVQRPSGVMPGSDTTAVFLGPIDTPPIYDAEQWRVTNAQLELVVEHDHVSVLRLRPGRYWLVESNGLLLTAEGCSLGAVTDVKVAVRVDPATGRVPG